MSIVFSTKAKTPNCSGFFFATDPNAPSDSFPVADGDHMSAMNLDHGYVYSFTPPISPEITGTLVVIPPDNSFLLASEKNKKFDELLECYLQNRSPSISYTSLGGIQAEYQADANSVNDLQLLLIGLNADPSILPADFFWVAMDNTHVPFLYADLQNLAKLMLQQGMLAFAHYQGKKIVVRNASTVDAIQSIVW